MTGAISERWRSGPWQTRADAERYVWALEPGKQAKMSKVLGLPARPILSPSVIKPAPAQVMRRSVLAVTPGSLCLTLPWMPSLNHYWRHMILKTPKGPQVRVLISEGGHDYRRNVVYQIQHAENPTTLTGARLAVALTLYPTAAGSTSTTASRQVLTL